MTDSDDLPFDPAAIATQGGEGICQEHVDVLAEWDIPTLNAVVEIMRVAIGSEAFYETAYVKKNGYKPPADVDHADLPDSESPGETHINEAIEEHEPLCCFIEDEVENPYPDDPVPKLIAVLARSAGEYRG